MARVQTLGTFMGGEPYSWPDGRLIVMPGAATAKKRRALFWLIILAWLYADGAV